MIICCYEKAAKLLVTRETFEVDMTFHRIYDSDIHEVVFAAYVPELSKGKSVMLSLSI